MLDFVSRLRTTTVRLFADSADLDDIIRVSRDPDIAGVTTNPTLMRAAGVEDYETFARAVLAALPDKPVSFEVLADDLAGMEREARTILGWGGNVFVKIPVTTTQGLSTLPLIARLSAEGHAVNVTAVMTIQQVSRVAAAISPGAPAIISIFAGRIADTGRDPEPLMRAAVASVGHLPDVEILWASPRELLNVFHADRCGCHIITATPALIDKLGLIGKDLDEYSRETVRMFHTDSRAAGYRL
ncbi:MAG: transaldolase [Rhodospirillales bacterium]